MDSLIKITRRLTLTASYCRASAVDNGAPGGTRTPINAFDGVQGRSLLLYPLSYQREWCAQYDSNVRPKPYKA